ncbi:MAG: nitroreductase family protein [Deltaproteobacteria bacterium]|nr:nitroreductase family protein [Deltaproteobacteria bacterium]
MDLFDAIKNRRSIRQYKTGNIDDRAIETILEAGHWAPSWANSQCWRFIVVRDPEIKAEISDTLFGPKLPDREVLNPAKKAIGMVSVIIVVCAEMGKAGFHPKTRKAETDKGDWFMFDVALAVQNMVLAAHALGLGTVIIGAFDARRVEKALNVPPGYRVVTMFPLGVPDTRGTAPPRKELSDITFNNRWGA